jgi:inorganic pyrophosphatase
MGLHLVSAGRNVPEEINVVIEIPKDAEPVKYEV